MDEDHRMGTSQPKASAQYAATSRRAVVQACEREDQAHQHKPHDQHNSKDTLRRRTAYFYYSKHRKPIEISAHQNSMNARLSILSAQEPTMKKRPAILLVMPVRPF